MRYSEMKTETGEVAFMKLDAAATPRKPNRVYESMTRVRVGPWNVRVWREEASLEPESNDDIRAAIRGRDFAASFATAGQIVALVEGLPRVVAVEVLDEDGNGVLLYPDWN